MRPASQKPSIGREKTARPLLIRAIVRWPLFSDGFQEEGTVEETQAGKEAPVCRQGSGSAPLGGNDHHQPPEKRGQIHESIHLSRMLI